MAIGRVNTGGGGAGAKLTIYAPVGATAKATMDGKEYTRSIRPDGTAIFNGLKTGVWNVEITKDGELPSSQNKLITADYDMTLAFFSSLIDVTYPVGSQCICTDGDITIQATDTSGHFVFNVQRTGRWYIRCTDGSQEAERYVDVTESGQNFAITMAYFAATIATTWPAGSTCTCSKGDIVFSAPDTSGSYTFTVPEAGDWTVSCNNGLDGDEYEETSKTVTITEDGQSESVELSYGFAIVEDGIVVSSVGFGRNGYAAASAPIVTPKSGYINIKCVSPHPIYALTNDKVDLTDHSKVIATVDNISQQVLSSVPSNIRGLALVVSKNVVNSGGQTGINNSVVASANTTTKGNGQTLSLDVSGITGSYYLGILMCTTGGHLEANLYDLVVR